ncbi:Flp pilus assembly protein TadD%2C contains TPR repeats [Achromobacter xylosoxidans]|uniref:type III secretion apparatus assembly chaperone SctY n=2 Tax=Pseudomonadota TaxID=1224 RepID=UPI0006BEC97F|nr:Flp pilus assembly protein TadD%2C contains TPR repeats [Achromobacter xylosoxidans]CUJ90994.1 Flp pilus assembly protein TadD%2C contains TPR repeats [Achromobacter xylosoxidans]CUR74140.1 putative PEP-CTERM system TPR-repeat lipoprotein [Achromobacter xylosoxidans]
MNVPAMLSDESREFISLLAFIYLENNRPERATALLNALEAAKASDSRSRCALALAQLRSGKPKTALATLDALAMKAPPTAVFHLLRSDCLQALERHEEARAAMRAFVALRQQAGPAQGADRA